jgi:predicted lipoprotein with Yx(FWY)xxD motif
VILTASVAVQETTTTVLTTAQARTLYYFTPDSAAQSACTRGCASAWPPLLYQGAGTPPAGAHLPGTLRVQQTGNGPRLEYNGHPLYIYSRDSAAGQASGQGIGGSGLSRPLS